MVTAFVTIFSILVTFGLWGYNGASIPTLFKLNKQLQNEGYYMTEFEFRMLGLAYWIDHGEFEKSMSAISLLKERMKSREGFVKIPAFQSQEEELEFYQNLQNPKTGAFMDDSYPYCTYEGPTGNVLEHMENLSIALGKPLQLKYPLSFLDSIADPRDLKMYLDDLSRIGWIGQKLPESSFHIIRDLISYTKKDNIVERHNLYQFSPEWKKALLLWFAENQDSITGYWGPRDRSSGKLVKLDLHNTSSIVKGFVDEVGHDLNPEFPLRYRSQMFQTTLQVMKDKEPDLDDEDEWHAFSLRRSKGIMLLTRYLWSKASEKEKQQAILMFREYLQTLFKTYWVKEEGAFRFYPLDKASLDGTGTAEGALKNLGYFPSQRRNHVWAGYKDKVLKQSNEKQKEFLDKDLQFWKSKKEINSIRVYTEEPNMDSLEQNVYGLIYLDSTVVPDVIEIIPLMQKWASKSALSLGNWVSRYSIIMDLSFYRVSTPSLIMHEFSLTKMNDLLKRQGSLILVGYDEFQIPKVLVKYGSN